jgi:hydroxyacylglutathione hydrolase
MTALEWPKVYPLGRDTWALDDRGSDVMYLAYGQERCMLIDTGWGVADLPALVTSLTSLPVTALNTHGHPDHTFGNGQFPEVHISRADEPLVQAPPATKMREWVAKFILPKPLPTDFDLETWATKLPGSLVPIEDGHRFDLGERVFEVIATPGHTPGSICLLDRDARFLFTGDSVVPGPVWLHLPESRPLGEFYASLQRLQGLTHTFDHILPAHGDPETFPLSKDILEDLAQGVASILDGSVVGREEKNFAGKGLRCDWSLCGIVYQPDRL